jgi:hypothetical protein
MMRFFRTALAGLLLSLFAATAATAQGGPPQPAPTSVIAGQVQIAVSNASSRAQLPSTAASAQSITIYNKGTKDAYYAFGSSSVVATTSSIQIPAGSQLTVWNFGSPYIAAITGGTDQTILIVYQGNGPIAFRTPGNGGGGTPGSGCVPSGSVNQILVDSGTGDCNTDGATSLVAGALSLGSSGTVGSLTLGNATTGTIKFQAAAGALGTSVASFLAGTYNVVGDSLTQALTGKTVNGLTINTTTGTFALTNGKTLTVSNSLTFSGTDASTLNIGAGGTLGTNAFTSTAYAPIASPTFTGTVTIPNGGVFGTPTSMTATNVTGLPLTSGVTGLLGVANGGVGISGATAANGTLLIGNGTGYSLATLTAGANITITNAAGGITIAASGGGGSPCTSTAFSIQRENSGALGCVSGVTSAGGVGMSFAAGAAGFAGSSTGTTLVNASAVASGTLTLPAATDTIVARATIDTFTHKTYDTAGTGNVFKINTVQITGISGTTATLGTTSGTLTAGNFSTFDGSGNIIQGTYVPAAVGAGAILATSPTLTASLFNLNCPLYTVNAPSLTFPMPVASSLQSNGGCIFVSNPSASTATVTPFSGDTITDGTGTGKTTSTLAANSIAIITSDGTSIDYVVDVAGGGSYSAPTIFGTSIPSGGTITSLGAGGFTGQVNFSANGALSAPSVVMSGSPITGGTGTNTQPLFFFSPSGATTITDWNTSGTVIGATMPVGYAGSYIDLRWNGSHFTVGRNGAIDSSSNIQAGTNNAFAIAGKNQLSSPTNGNSLLANTTGSGFTSLILGPDIAAPGAVTLIGESTLAGTSNIAGGTLNLAAGQGTGTGASGNIVFETAVAGSSGSTKNALTVSFTVEGSSGLWALGSTSKVANSTATVTNTALGPTGTACVIASWWKIKDAPGGNTVYIPAYSCT